MSVVHKVTEREMQSTPKFLSDVTVACVIPVFGRVEARFRNVAFQRTPACFLSRDRLAN